MGPREQQRKGREGGEDRGSRRCGALSPAHAWLPPPLIVTAVQTRPTAATNTHLPTRARADALWHPVIFAPRPDKKAASDYPQLTVKYDSSITPQITTPPRP